MEDGELEGVGVREGRAAGEGAAGGGLQGRGVVQGGGVGQEQLECDTATGGGKKKEVRAMLSFAI